jgi:hypothetical protein
VFPARYELNSYIVFRKRLVSKRLIVFKEIVAVTCENSKYLNALCKQNAEFQNVMHEVSGVIAMSGTVNNVN